ncbi:MAG: hypothetical protein CME70_07570 [Halobacteriovorax sp.]|nr:hypothetical protein [Halobacteriovorax sp.]|tara:strand:- start:325638 stop:327632 length:1995 start_codon:yes stop_codon:yes gene_type:complete
MHKCLKKLIIPIICGLSLVYVGNGFFNYLSIDWKVDLDTKKVETVFSRFKHIKYPLLFSDIRNRNQMSPSAEALKNSIGKQTERILKIYSNASSLFYLDYLPIKPIEKEFAPIDPIDLAIKLDVKDPTYSFISSDRKESLSLEMNFDLNPIFTDTKIADTNWENFYQEIGLEEEILSYADFFGKEKTVPGSHDKQEDLIKLVQSSTKRSTNAKAGSDTDDLVFFSYKEEKEENKISNAVLQAIERELKAKKKKSVASSKSRTVGGYNITTPEIERKSAQTKYKAKSEMLEVEVITLGVMIDKGFMEQVSGIEFIPHYDKNERFYDESEGVLRLSSNLEQSNYIYGTLLGKGFVNMRTTIPLFLGGGLFEVPLLEREALNKLLDKEGLKGLGSHLLIDLGDTAIDVDIDRPFEARTYLNEEFKLTTQEKNYKYILYVGVEPGNAVLRYLDSKGATLEKLTFLAESELTYEYFSAKKPYPLKFETFELNPLSQKAKELPISASRITPFGKEISPKQVGINSFLFDGFSRLSSSNSYLEFNHLGDVVFAGMRFSNYVILPSSAFIDSILNAEGLSNLENHCMIQLNLSEPVKNILFDGEDRVGPMDVKLHYLDEDGVLSEEPSLLTKHAFLLGTGQGVVNMQIEFLNGKKLVAQSFCSDGTYLVEQL